LTEVLAAPEVLPIEVLAGFAAATLLALAALPADLTEFAAPLLSLFRVLPGVGILGRCQRSKGDQHASRRQAEPSARLGIESGAIHDDHFRYPASVSVRSRL